MHSDISHYQGEQFYVFSVICKYAADGVTFSRVCDLLQSGAVMNKSYQPHEGHIPFLLQLFIDYNLYGMNLLNLAAVKFRRARKMGMELWSQPLGGLCSFFPMQNLVSFH